MLSFMLTRALIPVTAGIAAGVVISLWAARLVRALLYGVDPLDGATLAISIAVLMIVGAVSTWLPARRAVRANPAAVLHE
jgi:ABC-type antimicrobial peptide transport system permease subunit